MTTTRQDAFLALIDALTQPEEDTRQPQQQEVPTNPYGGDYTKSPYIWQNGQLVLPEDRTELAAPKREDSIGELIRGLMLTPPEHPLGTHSGEPKARGMKGMFNDFIDKVFQHEGGYTVDQGGETMYGVTWRDNKDLLKPLGYTRDTMNKLTPEHAKMIYKQRYYNEPGLNKLPEDLQYYVFDFGVNSGSPRAIKELQKVVGASPDGHLGPETLKKIQAYVKLNGMESLKRNYVGQRAEFYKKLARKNPKKHGKSLKGWLNRINYLSNDINKEHSKSVDV